jgi:hypothetical protein
MIFISFVSALLVCLMTKNVHAYLDPGTGSMILQVIAGSILAVTYTLKVYWKKVKALFVRKLD